MFASYVIVAVLVVLVIVTGIRLWHAATPPGGHRRVRSDGFLGFVTGLLDDSRHGERPGEDESRER